MKVVLEQENTLIHVLTLRRYTTQLAVVNTKRMLGCASEVHCNALAEGNVEVWGKGEDGAQDNNSMAWTFETSVRGA